MLVWLRVACFACLLAFVALSTIQSQTSQRGADEETRFGGSELTENVRRTGPRTPEEQRRGFTLPPGFEIQLYASEPDIGKPMNIAFDARGRLWVTQSSEYPFPAEPGKGTDRITILEDTNDDGKADRFTDFADTLNIPIGVLPYKNNEVIAYSIPSLFRFADTNRDGKADSQTQLLGPFEFRDTHGMANSLVRGYDGWVHACHGFTNESMVAGTDGHAVHMVSGNTFRFRPDGSRVEQTTYGRVNPFGLAYDELGYLYSSDCHSAPLYQLIRGADYPHFGKDEDMGFAPMMKPREDEATALAGIAYYADELFPQEYRRSFYVGDVVKSRIYRYSFEMKGSSPQGKTEPDFLLSADNWFRPVDIELGPDGALYVADFYNKIIGHYEVSLHHPGRDRERGRIWRITYQGQAHRARDLTIASAEALIKLWTHKNLALRMLVADQLVDRVGEAAVAAISAKLAQTDVDSQTYIHGLWVLHRLDALDDDLIKRSVGHPDAMVRVHTMRVLSEKLREKKGSDGTYYPLILRALDDKDPHVVRAALEALVQYPDLSALETALTERHQAPEYDTHLVYTSRLVLRNLLRYESVMTEVVAKRWNEQDAAALADVMIGVETAGAAAFLLAHMGNPRVVSDDQLSGLLEHAARFTAEDRVKDVIAVAKRRSGKDLNAAFEAFKAVREGVTGRGSKESTGLIEWGSEVAVALLDAYCSGPQAAEPAETAVERARLAVELAGDYELAPREPQVRSCLERTADPELKAAAARALIQIAPERNAQTVSTILQDGAEPLQVRTRIASMLGEIPGGVSRDVLASVDNAPPSLQAEIVESLAATSDGKAIIFEKVREGTILPRTLLAPEAAERILVSISPAEKAEYERLTANVPPVSKEKERLIAVRLASFKQVAGRSPPPGLVEEGEKVFLQNCSACHQVNGRGGLIGPQLDGIGNWGASSLAEKVLDPNRNVSEAFRTYTITTGDGKVLSGLFRRAEGDALIFADGSGKEFSVRKANIVEREPVQFTTMPDQFGNILSQEEFNALLAYLLSVRS